MFFFFLFFKLENSVKMSIAVLYPGSVAGIGGIVTCFGLTAHMLFQQVFYVTACVSVVQACVHAAVTDSTYCTFPAQTFEGKKHQNTTGLFQCTDRAGDSITECSH